MKLRISRNTEAVIFLKQKVNYKNISLNHLLPYILDKYKYYIKKIGLKGTPLQNYGNSKQ